MAVAPSGVGGGGKPHSRCDIVPPLLSPMPQEPPMPLSPEQLKAFDEEGYLFLPDCFSGDEVAALRREADLIYHSRRPEVWQEPSGAPRTPFTAKTYNEGFPHPCAPPRL